MIQNYNSVTSLAKLEKRLHSEQIIIGSNPIGCNKVNFIKIKNKFLFCLIKILIKFDMINKNQIKSNDVY